MSKQIKQLVRRLRRDHSKDRGQGLVEFALVLPVLILLMIGIMELGYFFFVYSTVNSAAREAVRYGSATGDNGAGVLYFQDCDGIEEVAIRIGRYANIQPGDVSIFYDNGPDVVCEDFTYDSLDEGVCGCRDGYVPELGARIVVQVGVDYYPIILFKEEIMEGVFKEWTTIEAESARTIIRRMQVGN